MSCKWQCLRDECWGPGREAGPSKWPLQSWERFWVVGTLARPGSCWNPRLWGGLAFGVAGRAAQERVHLRHGLPSHPAAHSPLPQAEEEYIPKQKEQTHFTVRLTEAKPVDKVKLIKEIKNYVQGINLVQVSPGCPPGPGLLRGPPPGV